VAASSSGNQQGAAGENGPGPVFHVGGISGGAVNFGQGGSAVNHVNTGPAAAPAPDPHQLALLAAVRDLRTDLARVNRTAGTEALEAELAGTAEEIEDEGAAAPGRLARLRTALAEAGPVAEFLASGAAVTAALATLLGS
jgi:hypothetical protein